MITNLSAAYDLGFLQLRPDGSLQAKFRIVYFFLRTDWAALEADLRNSDYRVFLRGFWSSIPVTFADDDLQDWLPKEDGYFVFPATFQAALAANTNTGLRIFRDKGITLLQAWRSRRHRHFVHKNGCWFESDSLGAFTIFQQATGTANNNGIPF